MSYCHVDGVKFPDGYAASGINGGLNMVASMNCPNEEHARLSVHGHKTSQYINRQSQAWLRNVLNRTTEEARVCMRKWQEATSAAVEALQITSSAIVPLHF